MNFRPVIFLLFVCLAACSKMDKPECSAPEKSDGNEEIIFRLQEDGIDFNVESTKTTPVTSVSSIYWYAADHHWEPYYEDFGFSSISCTLSSGIAKTGYYWPNEDTYYGIFFFACNKAFYWDYDSTCCLVETDNSMDVVVGFVECDNDYGETISMNLKHIFARTGTLTLSAPSGFTIKDGSVHWYLESLDGDYYGASGTAGIYDMCCFYWHDDMEYTELPQTEIVSSTSLYVIPNFYQLTVTYTLQKANWEKELTKSSTIELEAGIVNNISAVAPTESLSEIKFNVSVEAWSTTTISPTIY